MKEPDDMSMTAAAPALDIEGMTAVGGATAKVFSILRQRGMDPARAGLTEDRPDDTAEYQAEVYRQAWENSLRRAGHGDYIRYQLDQLLDAQGAKERPEFAEQHPEFLKGYIDQHVKVREKQREQSKVPPEERQYIRAKVLNVILAGGVGAGKTVAAAATGAYAVQQGLMARFVPHTLYLTWLRPDGAPSGMTSLKVVEFYERCDVLVLDDLGHEMDSYATNFVRTRTSELITARVNSNRPTLFTTNLTSEQLTAVLGDALFSRIGMRAEVLEMVGADRRMPKQWGIRRR